MYTVNKLYRDLPAAHRQHEHDGECARIHGHNWAFEIAFRADQLDKCGFVVDIGKLKTIKSWLEENFDHTLLINKNDPKRSFLDVALHNFSRIIIVPNCSMEGLGRFVLEGVTKILDDNDFGDTFHRNVRVVSVTVWEDSKNSATFTPNEISNT